MTDLRRELDAGKRHRLTEAVRDSAPIKEFTHAFYRYPARFSPAFARMAIETFSEPGDVVLDPFMGGGTTIVEALVAGRKVVGTDISGLSLFVAKAKTSPLSERDLASVLRWVEAAAASLDLRSKQPETASSQALYYGVLPWRMRKAVHCLLARLGELRWQRQRDFARAVILKTAQWALDCKKKEPSISQFRHRLMNDGAMMAAGMREFREQFRGSFGSIRKISEVRHIAQGSADELREEFLTGLAGKPSLVVTSPPYPGVHILYHRWQIRGRRETSAPFWIANCLDGHVESHFTLGSRGAVNLDSYFERARKAFSAIRGLLADDAVVVQLVGFTNPAKYLRRFLAMMDDVGFVELETALPGRRGRARLWRDVPNRKWYADAKGRLASSREVVLLHRVS